MERARFLRSARAAANRRGVPQPGAPIRRASRSGAPLFDLDRAPLALRAVLYPQRVIRLSGFRHGGRRTHHRGGAVVESVTGPAPAWPGGRRRKGFVEKTARGLLEATEQVLFAEDMAATGGFLQRLDPRVKLIGIGALIAAAVAVHRLWVLAAILALGVVLALVSHIPYTAADGARLAGRLAFTGAIALPAIFLTPGAAVYRLPLLEWPVTQQGLRTAGFLILRAETAATLSMLLILSTLWTRLLRALRYFRAPVVAGRHFGDDLSLYVPVPGHRARYVRIAREPHRGRAGAGRPPPSGRRQRGRAARQDPAGERRSPHGHAGARLSRRDSLLDELQMRPHDWLRLAAFVGAATLAVWLGR
jgi:cobalt/nickel transport system permease protein